MKSFAAMLSCLLLSVALTGCKVSVNSGGGQKLEGAGITFIVPLQSAQSQFGSNGINYRSEKLSATTDGKQLIVNGKSYGAVQQGDVVDLTAESVIQVNGQPRTANGV